jgi:carboxymethylenebutenolidase
MDILVPQGGRGRGVLVAHPWWGLNSTIREYGAALAREGFVVGLPDLFEGDITTRIEDAEKLIRKHWDGAEERLNRAIAELRSHSGTTGSVGAVGFSYGGFHLLEALARPDFPVTRVVTYYATHPLPERHAPVLAHFAADDDYESAQDMAALATALASAGPPNAAHTYPGTRHWFAERDRPEYDSVAATLAFKRTVAFLRGET